MSEYVRINITIGGPLPRSKVPLLLKGLEEDGILETPHGREATPRTEEELLELVETEFEDTLGRLNFEGEANYGILESLTETCRVLGLTYIQWAACTSDGDSSFFWWSPDYDDEQSCIASESERDRLIPEECLMEIKHALQVQHPANGEVFELARDRNYKALQIIDRLLPPMPEIPRLEITDA
jgi:hypothetical protein